MVSHKVILLSHTGQNKSNKPLQAKVIQNITDRACLELLLPQSKQQKIVIGKHEIT